ncbi:polysaccharide deacetylase family protein [Urechidicola croceus]|uniref:Polysaccharide deacetylase n=1 Tax=Urechidicola croceus TaxID=1850246 RepID=A0A1D8P694_9FLAO|nr:polysaccharide deacetylase family protein [Urechidicola croceus]AOW20101.1 polysaccharide deacetylase [Urechidicola croceus]
MKKNGTFVISLDYEIHWGVFDAMTLEAYGENIRNVNKVIDRLLLLCDKYGVKITFATVGMLFANSKEELLKFNPKLIPSYTNQSLNPFNLIDSIGNEESEDKLHYAQSTINKIKHTGFHEIGTHTYSHYNCWAPGQTIEQFEEDIIAAKKIGKLLDIDVQSIVFPKNQVNTPYLNVCYKHGISSYRGTEESIIYDTKSKRKLKRRIRSFIRLARLIDGYTNLTGHNTYDVEKINKSKDSIVNLPSSRFLRPYFRKLKFLESLKIKRITKSMKYAAKNNQLYHLWWHPHNFGVDMDENFNNLEKIFQAYSLLNKDYGFESKTMTELTLNILEK